MKGLQNNAVSRSRRSHSRDRHRRSDTPPTTSAQRLEMTVAQQAQITQFLSASLSGLGQATTVHSIANHVPPDMVRTDFSNLFNHASTPAGPNASALAIAAAKAKDLIRSKRLNEAMKTTSNGNSVNSLGNDSNDGELINTLNYLFMKILS